MFIGKVRNYYEERLLIYSSKPNRSNKQVQELCISSIVLFRGEEWIRPYYELHIMYYTSPGYRIANLQAGVNSSIYKLLEYIYSYHRLKNLTPPWAWLPNTV